MPALPTEPTARLSCLIVKVTGALISRAFDIYLFSGCSYVQLICKVLETARMCNWMLFMEAPCTY